MVIFMPKKLESPEPILTDDDSSRAKIMRIQKQRIDELERRLSMVEQKLEDLSEQFGEEFGEELEEEKADEKE
jgi:hypothetical protein